MSLQIIQEASYVFVPVIDGIFRVRKARGILCYRNDYVDTSLVINTLNNEKVAIVDERDRTLHQNFKLSTYGVEQVWEKYLGQL